VQQRHQVPAHDLYFGGARDVNARDGPVAGVDELHAPHVGGRRPDLRHDPHALGDVDCLVAHVDPVAASAQP
jgi:hypothetical protein